MEWIDQACSLDELAHHCQDHLELRERPKGTGTAYAYQCTLCGEAKGSEVAKRLVTQPVPPFDIELLDRYEAKRRELALRNGHGSLASDNIVPYRKLEALMTEFFSELEGEFGAELLTRSVQSFLRSQRERHVNQRLTAWQSEAQLADWLENKLSRDFVLLREVPGVGFVNRERRNLRLDFIIRAKQHLIDAGFTDQYLGIEVKFLDYAAEKGFHSKSSKGIFQALSYWYSGAQWSVGEAQPVSLASVLLFSNLSFSGEREHLFRSYDNAYNQLWWAYSSIASQANVGELLFPDYGTGDSGWSIQFNRARYFTRFPRNRLILGNTNLINRTRIGHSGKKKPT